MSPRSSSPFRIRRMLSVLLGSVALTACALPLNQPDIRLYVFDCGNILARDVSVFSPGVDQGQTKELTNSCYLIRHPAGDLVWDAGLPDSLGTAGTDAMNGSFHVSVSHPFAQQLAELQVNPASVRYLGISHFHFDHIGNANLFTGASLLIQEEEYKGAFGADPAKAGYDVSQYNKLDRNKIQQLKGDHDVFGDGRVVIKKAVGHTPGHQVLFLDLPKTGPIVLSGDLYHFTKNREFRRVPSFNYNKEQTEHSMEAIESFAQEKGAQFWIQHDKEQNEGIRHSPAFYQ
ncbi:MAG TPA: N-acyl homoserine lactonase family protein [Dongiaceae bacterium]|nr:N-acyl homoserine lactonase family protein [Dongiaceae bacterium]